MARAKPRAKKTVIAETCSWVKFVTLNTCNSVIVAPRNARIFVL